MTVIELTPAPDPVRCCELLDGLPYRIFLDSALRGTAFARYSFLAADPIAIVRSKGKTTEHIDLLTGRQQAVAGDALSVIQSALEPHRAPALPGLPPFQGGAAGYLAYDWANQLERLPAARFDDLAIPDVVLGIYDWVLAWDHELSRAWLISTGLPETAVESRERRAGDRAEAVRERLRSDHFRAPSPSPEPRAPSPEPRAPSPEPQAPSREHRPIPSTAPTRASGCARRSRTTGIWMR